MSDTLNILGPSFPLRFDAKGRLAVSTNEQHIRESVAQIIMTRRGSVPFKPTFGSNIPNRVFDPVNSGAMIAAEAKEAIERWEKRVENVRVELLPQSQQGIGELRFKITYRIKGDDTPQEATFRQRIA